MDFVTETKEIAFTNHIVNKNPLNESKQASYDWFGSLIGEQRNANFVHQSHSAAMQNQL